MFVLVMIQFNSTEQSKSLVVCKLHNEKVNLLQLISKKLFVIKFKNTTRDAMQKKIQSTP